MKCACCLDDYTHVKLISYDGHTYEISARKDVKYIIYLYKLYVKSKYKVDEYIEIDPYNYHSVIYA